MDYAEEENLAPDQKPPARLRPGGRQRRLLALVFKEGISFVDAVAQLHIRPRTIAKWLRQPLFMQYMFHHMTKFYVNAQIDRLRGVSNAVSSLSSAELSDAQRKAHVDLLRLHKVFSLDPAEVFGPLSKSNGPVSGPFGPVSDSFGPVSDSFGPVSGRFGPASKQDYPRFQPRNSILAQFVTKNHPQSGPDKSTPLSEMPNPPFGGDSPFDQFGVGPESYFWDCLWYRQYLAKWIDEHPEDPNVIAYRCGKKTTPLDDKYPPEKPAPESL